MKSGSIILSVNYRHAPEHPFPAAADDGLAALTWTSNNMTVIGGEAGQLAVAGWSAGGNIAAVVCQLARDAAGPAISGQILITPVVNADDNSPSMTENAEGFILTGKLMDWFWDNYTASADRTDPFAPSGLTAHAP